MLRFGRYELFHEIASGGMATVFLGRLTGVGGFARAVAIKRLHPQLAKVDELGRSLIDEARLASRIRHPNVVPVIDVVEADGEVCIVAEYVHGASLDVLVRAARTRGARVPPQIGCAIVAGMLRGLQAAHEAKDEHGASLDLVHRDVSPQNVLVDVDGVARVVDFGIAKAVGRLQETRDGSIKGKLAYMAPEQLRQRSVTRRADLYAAAVVLWEVLTGRRLFEAEDEAAVVAQVLVGRVPPPSSLSPEVPAAVDAIVARGTARDPSLRFESAQEMVAALESAIALATPSEVGAWVRSVASVEISARSALLEALERAPVDADSDTGGSGALAVSVRGRRASDGAIARKAPWGPWLAVMAALAGVLVIMLVVVSNRLAPTATPVRSVAAPAAPASVAAAPDPDDLAQDVPPPAPSEVADEGKRTDDRPDSARTKRPKKSKANVRAAPSAKVRADCDPPTYLDDLGHVRYKSGCLQ